MQAPKELSSRVRKGQLELRICIMEIFRVGSCGTSFFRIQIGIENAKVVVTIYSWKEMAGYFAFYDSLAGLNH